jgi:hypothetical protein
VAAPPTLDLFVASEFATSTKLNELWTAIGFGLATGSNPKGVFVGYQTTTQTLATSTWAAINLQNELVDTINGHSTVSNISRYAPGISGTYRCRGIVAFAGSAAGTRHAIIRVNGATVDGWAPELIQNNFGAGVVTVATDAYVQVNGSTDYLELYGWQDSGGNLATARVASQWYSWLAVEWVCP